MRNTFIDNFLPDARVPGTMKRRVSTPGTVLAGVSTREQARVIVDGLTKEPAFGLPSSSEQSTKRTSVIAYWKRGQLYLGLHPRSGANLNQLMDYAGELVAKLGEAPAGAGGKDR